MNDLIVMAASAGGVLLLIAIALALGFRQRARLDAEALALLAAAEGARVEASVIDVNANAAIARLGDGRWLAARVMADGVGARVFAAGAVRVRASDKGVTLRFDDLGYPALRLRLGEAPPDWLTTRAA